MHFIDLGESFPTHIYLQNLASIFLWHFGSNQHVTKAHRSNRPGLSRVPAAAISDRLDFIQKRKDTRIWNKCNLASIQPLERALSSLPDPSQRRFRRTSASAPWPACARWTTSRIGTQLETVRFGRVRRLYAEERSFFLEEGMGLPVYPTFFLTHSPNSVAGTRRPATSHQSSASRVDLRPDLIGKYRQMKAHWKNAAENLNIFLKLTCSGKKFQIHGFPATVWDFL